MSKKKKFFRDRTLGQKKSLKLSRAQDDKDLVARVRDLDPEEDGLIIEPDIGGYGSTHRGGKLNYRHGNYVWLGHPRRQKDALRSEDTPFDIIKRDLKAEFRDAPEEVIDAVGYYFRNVQGNDNRKRRVPFVWSMEGPRLYAYQYHESRAEIEVDPYPDAARVQVEGASVHCRVPSRTEGKSRYDFFLESVPIVDNEYANAIIWSLAPRAGGGAGRSRPEHDTFDIRYTPISVRENRDVINFQPHDIAAYLQICRNLKDEENNLVPWRMMPFPVPSREMASFYMSLRNNVLKRDESIQETHNVRHLHLDELSTLIARGYCSVPEPFWSVRKDGKLKDYEWSLNY